MLQDRADERHDWWAGRHVSTFCLEHKLQYWKRSLQKEFKEDSNAF